MVVAPLESRPDAIAWDLWGGGGSGERRSRRVGTDREREGWKKQPAGFSQDKPVDMVRIYESFT